MSACCDASIEKRKVCRAKFDFSDRGIDRLIYGILSVALITAAVMVAILW
jgi:hypothetical protein